MQLQTDIVYLVGNNAAGKSNFLDALRFIRDIAKPVNGGLRTALDDRGGLSKVRSLHAHGNKKGGGTDLAIRLELTDGAHNWTYELAVNYPRDGSREYPIISKEEVFLDGKEIIRRPYNYELDDRPQLAVTYLEQASKNKDFRPISQFLQGITYVHLVPQLVKFGTAIAGRLLPDDPFGQSFLKRISDCPEKTRTNRLTKIANSLTAIVPGLEKLNFFRDAEGRPHIEMMFRHFRAHPARQLEDQLSDGSLRLISILWLLMEKRDAPLLLEEPELSLNEAIVSKLHQLFVGATKGKNSKQVIVTTHSYALLSNPGIPGESLFQVIPSEKGSKIQSLDDRQLSAVRSGIPPADVVRDTSSQFELEIG